MTETSGIEIKKILELKKLELKISKAKTAKEELEVKIMERKLDISRMEDHLALQDTVILDAKEELRKIKGE